MPEARLAARSHKDRRMRERQIEREYLKKKEKIKNRTTTETQDKQWK